MDTNNIINLSVEELIGEYNKINEFLNNLNTEIKLLEEGINE